MTALDEFDRLEASALWRPERDAQRQEVILSLGEASLTLTTMTGAALAHWSLPAVTLISPPGDAPAHYSPGTESSEELEIADPLMIDAIARIQGALHKSRTQPRRLRTLTFGVALAALIAVGVVIVPPALVNSTKDLLPESSRGTLGGLTFVAIKDLVGQPCETPAAAGALERLTQRMDDWHTRYSVVDLGERSAISLPGGHMVLNRNLVEDYDTVDVLAGHIIAERVRAQADSPLHAALTDAGFWNVLKLRTTGHLAPSSVEQHAISLLNEPAELEDMSALADAFAKAGVPSAPYAYIDRCALT